MQSLWPVWNVNLNLNLEAINEDVAKQAVAAIERQLNLVHGVHVLGATVLKKQDPTSNSE